MAAVWGKVYDVLATLRRASGGERRMRNSLRRVSLLSVSVLLLLIAPSSTSAMDRSAGDYWVYSMFLAVPEFGVTATGTLRYEFVSQESLTIGGAAIPVNVMRVTGTALGAVPLIDLSAAVVIEGYVYEGIGDMSTVRSALTYWTNVSWGSGEFSWPINTESRSSSTYTPGLLFGFEPGVTAPGDSWTESIEVRTVYYNTTTGMEESETSRSMTVAYSVHTELETVSTGAGSFEAMRITATESGVGRVMYWWSEDVGLFVKEETYVEGSALPVQTLSLDDYSGRPHTNVLFFVAVGGLATAVALVFLALVLLKRRPPRRDLGGSKPLELLPPPP